MQNSEQIVYGLEVVQKNNMVYIVNDVYIIQGQKVLFIFKFLKVL